jgi:flagellar L-ring protein precursor FlgH
MRNAFLPLLLLVTVGATVGCLSAEEKKPKKAAQPSPLDQYLKDALARPTDSSQASIGSLWSPASRLTDLGSDVRANHVDDLVTILVNEQASAVVQGVTQTQRQSTATSAIAAAAGLTNPTGAWNNLLNTNTQTQLNGQGTTSRTTTLSTALSARVTHVLPNGYLVVEASKEVDVNSEHQLVTVRGIIRPADLTTANTINSDQIAQMELRIDGKGVVNDAIRRPFVLWRVLMGLLPF